MIRTLKITSYIAATAAGTFVVFLVVSGLKGNTGAEKFLAQPSVIEQFKQKTAQTGKGQNKVSPLVQQAKNLANRINPPPPPPPKETASSGPPKPKTPPTPPPPKFTLLGTCWYEKTPGRSIALLDVVGEGQKWVSEGEKIGHYTVNQIKNGSVVLYANGQKNTELFVPRPEPTKVLLKAELVSANALRYPSASVLPDTGPPRQPQPPQSPVVGSAAPVNPAGTPAVVVEPMAGPQVLLDNRVEESLPVEPTPEEKKGQLDSSISGIRKIMSDTSTEGLSAEEQEQERKAWENLLNSLQKEREELDNTAPPAPNAPASSPTRSAPPAPDTGKVPSRPDPNAINR